MNYKVRRYETELKIVEALRKRLSAGGGWTRIQMKEDGACLDISVKASGYLVAMERGTKLFEGLDEVAEWIMRKGWTKVP